MIFDNLNVAYHYVDPQADGPIFSDHEVDIEKDFSTAADREAVRKFIHDHLRSIWEDRSNWAVPADFQEDSAFRIGMASWRGGQSLLDFTKSIAQQLHQTSPRSASAGLLLAIDFYASAGEPVTSPERHLALIKLDPGKRDFLALQHRDGQVLLELAVEHIELALPDPGSRVLKWAIFPNPDDSAIDAKLHDRQSPREPAAYFTDFLGAEIHKSDADILDSIATALEKYAESEHEADDWLSAMPQWLQAVTIELGSGRRISRKEMSRTIAATGALAGTDSERLVKYFRKEHLGRVKLDNPSSVPSRTLSYELDNGIRISGPTKSVLALVHVTRTGMATQFCTQSTGYRRKWGGR